MDFYLLQKILAKTEVISIVKNLLTVLKKSATDAIKTASNRAIQKTAEATEDLIGNKIADKIIRTSKNLKSCTQMKLIMKYQKKDLRKKDNKLLTN